jgi:ABC-type antimicrobial peptide transport system ATPase subunit
MLKPRFLRSWQMQPLGIAQLAALTPKEWSMAFFDDRIESIDYNIKTDLVAISMKLQRRPPTR